MRSYGQRGKGKTYCGHLSDGLQSYIVSGRRARTRNSIKRYYKRKARSQAKIEIEVALVDFIRSTSSELGAESDSSS